MNRETPTRVWWDGDEVAFIRWTSSSLVFSWMEPTVTAMQMPRGAVIRLMEKGVLQIEGEAPDWVPMQFCNNLDDVEEPSYASDYPSNHQSIYQSSHQQMDYQAPRSDPTPAPRAPHPLNLEPPVSPGDTQPLEPIEPDLSKPKRPDLARAIGRLIRKLSGGDKSPDSARAPEPAPIAPSPFRTSGVVGPDGDHRVERRAQPASR